MDILITDHQDLLKARFIS